MIKDTIHVQYTQGRAQVKIGERTFEVDRRDDDTRTHTCPIELVTAALGS